MNFNTVVTCLAVLAILAALVWEDRINGYVAKKRMPVGTEKSVSLFTQEGYTNITELGKSEFNYKRIALLAETGDYFAFVFDASHAQVYQKSSIAGGTVQEFRTFIQKVTGKEIQTIR